MTDDDDGSAALLGRVVRADTGEGVAGAVVASSLESWSRVTTVADAQGRFRIEHLDAGRYRPSASAEGLFGQAPESIYVREGETRAEIVIALLPAASLRGRLELAVTSAPCPGGVVELHSTVAGDAAATADAAGDVLFPALLPARYDVQLTCPGHAARENAPPLDVGDSPHVERFVVHEQLAIPGVVVNEDGQPELARTSIRGQRLQDGDSDGFDAMAYSGDDGRFELRVKQAGTYEVYAQSRADRLSVRSANVTVAEGAPVPEVRLTVRSRHVVEGAVVDDRGRPFAFARVGVQSASSHWSYHTGADGRFTLAGLVAGRVELSVQQGSTDLVVIAGDTEPMIPTTAPITLVAKPLAGRITGRVLHDGHARGPIEIELSGERAGAHFMDWATTLDDGSFSATVQPDTDYTLTARTERGETAIAEHVAAGARVEMRLLPGATLRGKLRGAPRAFRVSLSSSFRDEVFFGTDGAWEMRDVPAGETSVDVFAGGLSAETRVTLAPGETRTLDLELRRSADEPRDESDDASDGGDPPSREP